MSLFIPQFAAYLAILALSAAAACAAGTTSAFPEPNATDCRPPFDVSWTRPGENQDIIDVDRERVYYRDQEGFGALALPDGRQVWRQTFRKSEDRCSLQFAAGRLIAYTAQPAQLSVIDPSNGAITATSPVLIEDVDATGDGKLLVTLKGDRFVVWTRRA